MPSLLSRGTRNEKNIRTMEVCMKETIIDQAYTNFITI